MEDTGVAAAVLSLILLVLFIFIMRLLGAWMLRINEVIAELRKISALLNPNQLATDVQVKSVIDTNKGLKLMEEGDHKEAISLFKEAVKKNPDANVNYYNIACAYSHMSNTSEALRYLKLAMQTGYNNYEKLKSDPDLERVVASEEFQRFQDNGYK